MADYVFQYVATLNEDNEHPTELCIAEASKSYIALQVQTQMSVYELHIHKHDAKKLAEAIVQIIDDMEKE